MDSAAQPGDGGTFLWIGDGGRPTYGVVEHFLRWQWPGLLPGAQHHHLRQWRLYTLDHQPTLWHLTDCWPRAGHLQGDFLVWDATPYRPYEVVFVDNILCSGHATQSIDPTIGACRRDAAGVVNAAFTDESLQDRALIRIEQTKEMYAIL